LRKDTPELMALVNTFVAKSKKGTMLGNMLVKRYFATNKWVRNPGESGEYQRLLTAVDYLKRYAEEYNFDWLMIAAQAYQESRIDQKLRSPAGAMGVMQLLPTTAADKNVGIADISSMENNIHAGVKYLRFMTDRYFDDPAIDQENRALFAFASYNAGPAKIARLRTMAKERGLDPNVWFYNVENIAAEVIGRETVTYVSNIAKYHYAYRMILAAREGKKTAKDSLLAPQPATP
jgi:membrane-bound lytic murein transglycosylase MltF